MKRILTRFKTPEWLKAAFIRGAYTFIEVFLSFLAVGMTVTDAPWKTALSTSFVAFIISFAKSILIGMPEVKDHETPINKA